MSYKIVAVVVTYFPEQNVLESQLDTLLAQGCQICIVHNSKTAWKISPKYLAKEIYFPENMGIAHAQQEGMVWAFGEGKAEFVIQMDQDSVPDQNLVKNQLSAWEKLTADGHIVGLVGAQDIDRNTGAIAKAKVNKGKKIKPYEQLIEVTEVLSSGSLIPKATFLKVGVPDKKLFIDIVDFEYCWRIGRAGLLVVKNNEGIIYHSLGEGTVKIFGFLKVGLPKPFRHYYAVRNSVYLILYGNAPLFWKLSNTFKIIFKFCVYPFSLPEGKIRFSYISRGIKDGIQKKFNIIND
jgi:rhamnosyltransferase